MEYLKVLFPRSRRVKIDEEFNGRTNELIELEAGTYTVSLGPPANFTPRTRRVLLKDTSEFEPKKVAFYDA